MEFDNKDRLLRRCLDSLDWLIKDVKWRFDQVKSGSRSALINEGEYSPELNKAIILRDALAEYFLDKSGY